MRHTPLVSVIVNNYNYGRFLREAIDSALTQTYPCIEVVVVDDGSTDGSQEIVADYGDRVLAVMKGNGGQASAFNAGFAKCRGDIVIFLDADDYLFPRAVERMVAAWKPGTAKVQYRLEMVDAFGSPMGFYPPLSEPLTRGNVVPELFKTGTYVCPVTSGNGFSRTALQHVIPAPEDEFRISADGYLQVTVPLYGHVEAIDEALGAYRIHGNNLYATEARRGSSETNAAAFLQKLEFLHHKVLRHKLLCHIMMTRKAMELGYFVPPIRDHKIALFQVALLRLDPQDRLVSLDRPLSVICRGLRATWLHSGYGWRRLLTHSAGLILIGLMPLPIAKALIVWLFAAEYRPKVVERVLRRGRGDL